MENRKPNRKQYPAPPEMALDNRKACSAVFKMAKGGEFTLKLHADKAPITVNSFVFLAREGYLTASASTASWKALWRRAAIPPAQARAVPVTSL